MHTSTLESEGATPESDKEKPTTTIKPGEAVSASHSKRKQSVVDHPMFRVASTILIAMLGLFAGRTTAPETPAEVIQVVQSSGEPNAGKHMKTGDLQFNRPEPKTATFDYMFPPGYEPFDVSASIEGDQDRNNWRWLPVIRPLPDGGNVRTLEIRVESAPIPKSEARVTINGVYAKRTAPPKRWFSW